MAPTPPMRDIPTDARDNGWSGRIPLPVAVDQRPEGLFFKGIFALAYALLIIASIRFVRDNTSLLEAINIVRIALVALAAALWIGRSTIDRSLPLSVIVISLVMSPYLLTDAIISYVDVVSLLAFSAAVARSRNPDRFFVYAAYGSLALVVIISALATLGVLPSTALEWNGRVKNSFGFTNPNTFFFYIFSSAFVFFVFKRVRGLVICGVIISLMYVNVGSRTFALAYLFIAGGYLLAKRIDGPLTRLGLQSAIVAVALVGMLTIYFPRGFSDFVLSMIGIDSDELFSSRLSIMEFDLAYFDMNKAEFWLGGMENISDSMYAYFANGFGLMLSIVALLFTFYKARLISSRYGSVPLIFVLAFLMIGIVEVPLDGSALMSLIFIYAIFYDDGVFARWASPYRLAGAPDAG